MPHIDSPHQEPHPRHASATIVTTEREYIPPKPPTRNILPRGSPHKRTPIGQATQPILSHAGRAWPCRDGATPRWPRDPPPMVGGIPACPRVVSRATLPEPVAASRWLYPPPFLFPQ
eukprot:COSAG05_NODE_158_length_15673_cov_23.898946_10_plen_117_part_00